MKLNAGGSCKPPTKAATVFEDLTIKVDRREKMQNAAVLSDRRASSSAVKNGKTGAVCSSVRADTAEKSVTAQDSSKEACASKRTSSCGKPSMVIPNAKPTTKHVQNVGINGATKLSASGSCEPAVKDSVICKDLTIKATRPGNMQNVAVLSGTRASSSVLTSSESGHVYSSVRSDSAAKAEVEKKVPLPVSIFSYDRFRPMRVTYSLALLPASNAKTSDVMGHPNVTNQLCVFAPDKRKGCLNSKGLNSNFRHEHMKKQNSHSSNVRKSKIEVNSPLMAPFGNGRKSHGVFSAFLPRRCRLRRFCTLWNSLRACRRPYGSQEGP